MSFDLDALRDETAPSRWANQAVRVSWELQRWGRGSLHRDRVLEVVREARELLDEMERRHGNRD